MSETARQTPPERPAARGLNEVALGVVSESVWWGLSFLGGLTVIFVLVLLTSIVTGEAETQPAWLGIIGGPILLGTAWGCYRGLEALLVSKGDKSYAMVPEQRQLSVVTSLGAALGAITIAVMGSSLIGWVQAELIGVEIEEQAAIVELVARGDAVELALLTLTAVVLAPLAEELLFREMFFRRLYHRTGLAAALIVPALAFAISHWNPVGLAVYAWLAVVFALTYLYTGRIFAAILAHAGHNAIVLAILVFGPESPLQP